MKINWEVLEQILECTNGCGCDFYCNEEQQTECELYREFLGIDL